MSKKVPDDIIDLLLAGVATGDRMDAVDDVSTPTDLTGTLANVSMTPGDGNDYTIAPGDVSGRKVTMAEKLAVSITGTGTANHVVISLAGVFKDVTTCTAQGLTSGGTVDFPAWDHEVLQAA
ncbi:hypothetical protein KAR91_30895 [Candidatus Pacearchaeota archaeon]|nr:hypothetical protein [Candidatus Pacearchaeota archaeon]